MNPEFQKLLDILAEQKEHSFAFREDMNAKMNETIGELKQVGRRLDISNGRMAKQEEATQKLREEDIGMNKELKFIKENGTFIRDRTWILVVGILIAVSVSLINKFLIK